ncbi:MAG: DivIVA domain-containing protein [Candidatus Caldipriscus sp.]
MRSREFTMVGGIGKKGYDPDEVRDFLNKVAKYVEELEKTIENIGGSSGVDTTIFEAQIEQISEENEELRNKGGGGISWEDLPEEKLATEILKLAKQTGDNLIEEKKKEAENIILNAKLEVENLKKQAEDIKREIETLEFKKKDLMSQLDAVKSQIRNEILALAKKVENLANNI